MTIIIWRAQELALRACCVFLAVAVALAVPFYGVFLSLIGDFSTSLIMFVFPPLCYAKVRCKLTSVGYCLVCV